MQGKGAELGHPGTVVVPLDLVSRLPPQGTDPTMATRRLCGGAIALGLLVLLLRGGGPGGAMLRNAPLPPPAPAVLGQRVAAAAHALGNNAPPPPPSAVLRQRAAAAAHARAVPHLCALLGAPVEDSAAFLGDIGTELAVVIPWRYMLHTCGALAGGTTSSCGLGELYRAVFGPDHRHRSLGCVRRPAKSDGFSKLAPFFHTWPKATVATLAHWAPPALWAMADTNATSSSPCIFITGSAPSEKGKTRWQGAAPSTLPLAALRAVLDLAVAARPTATVVYATALSGGAIVGVNAVSAETLNAQADVRLVRDEYAGRVVLAHDATSGIASLMKTMASSSCFVLTGGGLASALGPYFGGTAVYYRETAAFYEASLPDISGQSITVAATAEGVVTSVGRMMETGGCAFDKHRPEPFAIMTVGRPPPPPLPTRRVIDTRTGQKSVSSKDVPRRARFYQKDGRT